jgi:hypothetical protein
MISWYLVRLKCTYLAGSTNWDYELPFSLIVKMETSNLIVLKWPLQTITQGLWLIEYIRLILNYAWGWRNTLFMRLSSRISHFFLDGDIRL